MARKKKTEQEQEINSGIENNDIYQDDIDYYYKEFCNCHNIKDIYKTPAPQFIASLIYINHRYIAPNRIIYKGAIDGYQYNLLTISALADRYIYMCYIYNQPIQLIGFSHLSGIGYEYICRWKYNDNSVVVDIDTIKGLYSSNGIENRYIYNIDGVGLIEGKRGVKGLTISYQSIYRKLTDNQVNIADLIALYKSGVNSIAYANRVHDKLDKDKRDSKPVFDMLSVADSLGISDKLQGIEGKKGKT